MNYEENGSINIHAKYRATDSIWLGRWLYEQKPLCKGEGRPLRPEQWGKLAQLELSP